MRVRLVGGLAVAVDGTRARDWLNVSRHERTAKRNARASAYFDYGACSGSNQNSFPGSLRKAEHHVLRTVAEHILDHDFFCPTANKPAHKEMKQATRQLIVEYVTSHADGLRLGTGS